MVAVAGNGVIPELFQNPMLVDGLLSFPNSFPFGKCNGGTYPYRKAGCLSKTQNKPAGPL